MSTHSLHICPEMHNFVILETRQTKRRFVAPLFFITAAATDLFVWIDYLPPSQQFFSYFGMGLPGLNQY